MNTKKLILAALVGVLVNGCANLKEKIGQRFEFARCMDESGGNSSMGAKGIGVSTLDRDVEKHCDWMVYGDGKKYLEEEEKRAAEKKKRKVNKILKQAIKDAKAKKEQQALENEGQSNE